MKKRSSNQIKSFIIVFVAILMIALIGLIVFLLNVDIKRNVNNQENSEEKVVENEKQEYESISLENYTITKKDSDNIMEIKILNGKLILDIINELKFKEIYPDSIIDTNEEFEIAVHENKIEDIIISKIGEKHYLLVITDKGHVGIMNIEDAVENDVFRIKNSLISFEKPVIRLINAETNNGEKQTVIVILSDGNKYDLSNIVE